MPQAVKTSVLDVLDRLLDRGVVLRGDLLLTVADVELVTVSLAAVVASTATLDRVSGPRLWSAREDGRGDDPPMNEASPPRFETMRAASHAAERSNTPPEDVRIDPDDTERGLVKLVLTVVELLRQLMERQAIRRMTLGSLSPSQCERVGRTFLNLDRTMSELVEHFRLRRDELNLDLGPIGNLI